MSPIRPPRPRESRAAEANSSCATISSKQALPPTSQAEPFTPSKAVMVEASAGSARRAVQAEGITADEDILKMKVFIYKL